MKNRESAPIAFLRANVGYQGEGCLIWPFYRNKHRDGHGSFGHEGKMLKAHRWMCEAVHGPAPTPEHQAAHECGNGDEGCIHPKHLFWKTPLENSQDKIKHGTCYSGKGRPRAKLRPEDVVEIRKATTTAEQRQAAERFGVSTSMVRKILYGNSWTVRKRPFKHFTDDEIRRIRSLREYGKAGAVAEEYQVSANVIRNIWTGKCWAHVPSTPPLEGI